MYCVYIYIYIYIYILLEICNTIACCRCILNMIKRALSYFIFIFILFTSLFIYLFIYSFGGGGRLGYKDIVHLSKWVRFPPFYENRGVSPQFLESIFTRVERIQ